MPNIILQTGHYCKNPTQPAIVLQLKTRIVFRYEGEKTVVCRLPKGPFNYITALLVAGTLTRNELVEQLYIEDPNGGAEYAPHILNLYRYKLKILLSPLGIEPKLVRHNLYEVVIHDLP